MRNLSSRQLFSMFSSSALPSLQFLLFFSFFKCIVNYLFLDLTLYLAAFRTLERQHAYQKMFFSLRSNLVFPTSKSPSTCKGDSNVFVVADRNTFKNCVCSFRFYLPLKSYFNAKLPFVGKTNAKIYRSLIFCLFS